MSIIMSGSDLECLEEVWHLSNEVWQIVGK